MHACTGENHARSYRDTLMGMENSTKDGSSGDEDHTQERSLFGDDKIDDDYSGFQVIKKKNEVRDCPTFLISKEEETRMDKPWCKTLIIKLLREKDRL